MKVKLTVKNVSQVYFFVSAQWANSFLCLINGLFLLWMEKVVGWKENPTHLDIFNETLLLEIEIFDSMKSGLQIVQTTVANALLQIPDEI